MRYNSRGDLVAWALFVAVNLIGIALAIYSAWRRD